MEHDQKNLSTIHSLCQFGKWISFDYLFVLPPQPKVERIAGKEAEGGEDVVDHD